MTALHKIPRFYRMAAMTRVCIVRHGETDWNLQGLTQGSRDVPLNERGRQQARAAAAYLAELPWDAIYASPLSRAWETAEIISSAAGLFPIRSEPRLAERDFGSAEGMDVAERKRRYPDREIPGAENWRQVRIRGCAAAERIVRENPGERVVAVAHGGVIGALLGVLSGGSLGPGRPPLANCSLTMLCYRESWEILWYNRVAPDLDPELAGAFSS
jgi:broad specificity phosphatase PhoE